MSSADYTCTFQELGTDPEPPTDGVWRLVAVVHAGEHRFGDGDGYLACAVYLYWERQR